LLFEWNLEGHPSIDINLKNMDVYYHTFKQNGEELEINFLLNFDDDFESFFNFLSNHIPS